MTNLKIGWDGDLSPRFATLMAPFRPILARIREGAAARDISRSLPIEEIGWLRTAGFQKLRLPVSLGGQDATLPELFAAIMELGEADPNIANALRAHLGFVEDVLCTEDGPWRDDMLALLGRGDTLGSANTEIGATRLGEQATRLHRYGERMQVSGKKYYTTGSLYADWMDVSVTDDDGQLQRVLIGTRAAGVNIVDDWDGFGQRLTASGTVVLENVEVEATAIKPGSLRFPYFAGFYQLFHLATMAGIARAVASEVATHLRDRRRVYARGNGEDASRDPQILQIVGKLSSQAYCAAAIVEKAAKSMELAYIARQEVRQTGAGIPEWILDQSEIGISQAVNVVTGLTLDNATAGFDALGASATKISNGLDRHWRNARTITSHNPRVYHDRSVGEFAVHGRFGRDLVGVGIGSGYPSTTAPGGTI